MTTDSSLEPVFGSTTDKVIGITVICISPASVVLTPWPTLDQFLGIPEPEGAVELLRTTK